MSRIVSSANQTESAKLSLTMVTMVDLDYSSGHVYAHDGVGPLTWGGHTYDGVGQYGGINVVTESLDVIARSVKLTLSGVDASLITHVMAEVSQGRAATIYLAFVDQATGALVDTPETIWAGKMDTHDVEIDDGVAVITVNCESRLRREPRIARYTDQDEQLAYSGDVFFNLIYQIPGFRSQWGAVSTAYGSAGSGRGRDGGVQPTPLP